MKAQMILLAIFLSGCSLPRSLDYVDLPEEVFGAWESLFAREDQHVYVFSYTCSHCEKIKSEVLSYLVHQPLPYLLVEGSSRIPKSSQPLTSIGATTVDQVSIQGYPTLIVIEDGILQNLYTGSSAILAYCRAMNQ